MTATTPTLVATPDPDDRSGPRSAGAMGQLRDWALHLATDMGWRVFPVAPGANAPPAFPDHTAARCTGRDPRCRAGHMTWEQRSTDQPQRITRCWSTGIPYNIAVATGPSRLLAVDLDVAKADGAPDGAKVLTQLCAERGGALPDTYTVETPSGGQHLYYRMPPGVHLGVTKGARRPDGRVIGLGPNVDTRGEGGYVVAAGSIRPDGAYELLNDTPPAELPAWIVQVLCERRTPEPTGGVEAPRQPGPYVATAIANETRAIRGVVDAEGQHNWTVNKAAFNLGTLIGAGDLDLRTARDALTDAARVLVDSPCECTERELDAVITAGLAAGTRKPRHPGRAAA